jgi:3-oxoacyl-[acyl-carrier protein] reductase
MSELNGKVALLTGASRGIGRAIALASAQAGCDVALNYGLSSKEAETMRVEIIRVGRRSIAVAADVSRVDEVEGLFTAVERDLGPIDLQVNNAG